MGQQDIKLLLQRQPCPKLRLHMTNGLVFEISDPDLVVLGRSAMELLLPALDASEREAVISLLHIIWVEVLPPSP